MKTTTPEFVTLDALGSFRTIDGRFEAICWTHRGEGWDVCDWTPGEDRGAAVRTKREAIALVRKLAKGA